MPEHSGKGNRRVKIRSHYTFRNPSFSFRDCIIKSNCYWLRQTLHLCASSSGQAFSTSWKADIQAYQFLNNNKTPWSLFVQSFHASYYYINVHFISRKVLLVKVMKIVFTGFKDSYHDFLVLSSVSPSSKGICAPATYVFQGPSVKLKTWYPSGLETLDNTCLGFSKYDQEI